MTEGRRLRIANRLAWTIVVLAAMFAPQFGTSLVAAATAEVGRHYEQGLRRLTAGDIATAIVELNKALRIDPDHVPSRLLIGRAYVSAGDGASAEDSLERARDLGASDEQSLIPLARAYLLQRKYSVLLETVLSGRGVPELEGRILVMRGMAFLGVRRLAEAERAFGDAAALLPDSPEPLLGLARLALERGLSDEADRLVDDALARVPSDAEALYMKGEVDRVRGDMDGALAFYDRAIEDDKRHVQARQARAQVLLEIGRLEDARIAVDELRETSPFDPELAYVQAKILREIGDDGGANAALNEASYILSNYDETDYAADPRNLYLAANVNYLLGYHEDAEPFARDYFRLRPDDPAIRRLLARLFVANGRGAEATQLLRPLRRANPDDPDILALVGQAATIEGRHEVAIPLLERALQLAPDDVSILGRLGYGRVAAGDIERGLNDLEDVMARDPRETDLGHSLAKLLLDGKEFTRATEVAYKLIDRAPRNPVFHNLVGAAALGLEDVDAARAAFEAALAVEPTHVPAMTNLARIEIRLGNDEAARNHLVAIHQSNPDDIEPMLELARLAEQDRRFDDAIRWLEMAVQAESSDIALPVRLIDFYIRNGYVDDAVAVARTLELADDTSLEVIEAVGNAELAAGNRRQAAAAFRRAAVQAGASPRLLVRAGRNQLAAGDEAGAERTLEGALRLDPERVDAHALLAELDARRGRTSVAMRRIALIRRSDPESPLSDRLEGDMMMANNLFAAAVLAYETAFRKEPSSDLLVRLFKAQRSASPGDIPVDRLEAWIADHPDSFDVVRVLGDAYVGLGRLDEALVLHERLVSAGRVDADILNNLASLYGQRQDPRALRYADMAHELAPGSADVLDTYGWLLVQNGEAERGLAMLREANARSTGNPDIRYHIAYALNALGRTNEARAVLETLFEMAGPDPLPDGARDLLHEIARSGK